jgi:hypothetical protein
MNENEKAKLLAIFKRSAYGSQNARHKSTFTWMLWDKKNPSSAEERNFRLLVEALVEEGEPICSHPDFGYWYARDLDDGDAAIADLTSRETAIRTRRQRLETNLSKHYGGQIGLGI